MSRPDQSITFLRSQGYSVFRFPRASAQPLELMHREGKDLTRLGMITDLVTPGEQPAPDVRKDANPGIDIEGKETSKINVAIGLSILGSFIGALGGGKLGLDVAFNKARTITFQYAGVIEDVVDVLALEKFVKAGRIGPHIPAGTLEKLLDDEVYVVTSVLKTKKIIVAAQGETGTTTKVDVPIIQQAVGAKVDVGLAGTHQARVAFEGDVPVAFAFQAVQLVFDDSGEFLTTQQLPAGDAAARGLQPPRAMRSPDELRPVFLEARGAFVRVAHEEAR
jgi:hypothetical protein